VESEKRGDVGEKGKKNTLEEKKKIQI